MMEIAVIILTIIIGIIFIVYHRDYILIKNLEAQVKQQQFAIEKLLELQRADSIRILQIERELDV